MVPKGFQTYERYARRHSSWVAFDELTDKEKAFFARPEQDGLCGLFWRAIFWVIF
jgi:hypothetical protein